MRHGRCNGERDQSGEGLQTAHEEATERAKQHERLARVYAKRAQEGDAGAAQLAQTFGSLAVAARTERMDWRMRVLGDQLPYVKKSMGPLRRKLRER
ncbi:hypothetical protein FBY37_0041 [Streptomyces sp. SLBN-134]|nr:hypothetical protein FBY37_0041 [Streptomyces sp. SLBN-134]